MYEYMMWMDERVGMAATVVITASALGLLIALFAVWLSKKLNLTCPTCGGGLRQLGYMDSRPIWCPRCNP